MQDLFDKEDIDDDSVVDMMCIFEVTISQPKGNNEKGDGFQDAMNAILQNILHGNDERGVEDVKPSLAKILDEVGDAIDAILKMMKLDLESVVDLLGTGYNMAEIEIVRGVQIELDDMPPDVNEVEDIPYVDGVFEGNEVE
ncbi:unnamed protein product [Lactuca saligna]|uniref:Uncharacterized protein n=1 Tax=Lactuca saligna TaxID=75948 RepID=A0AA36E9M9_LACSI|nr:unnamed protein product [Lactuca saligna]